MKAKEPPTGRARTGAQLAPLIGEPAEVERVVALFLKRGRERAYGYTPAPLSMRQLEQAVRPQVLSARGVAKQTPMALMRSEARDRKLFVEATGLCWRCKKVAVHRADDRALHFCRGCLHQVAMQGIGEGELWAYAHYVAERIRRRAKPTMVAEELGIERDQVEGLLELSRTRDRHSDRRRRRR